MRTLKDGFLFLSVLLLIFSSEVSRASACNDALIQAKPVAEQDLVALQGALAKLEKLNLQKGTLWLEERWEKRRASVLEQMRKAGFAKLVLLKPELRQIISIWLKAMDRLPEIEEAYTKMGKIDQKAFLSVYDAVRSALVAHPLSWALVSTRDLDFPRIGKILGEIAAFESARPRYSLYRIQRAIEGRYSLREYAECR